MAWPCSKLLLDVSSWSPTWSGTPQSSLKKNIFENLFDIDKIVSIFLSPSASKFILKISSWYQHSTTTNSSSPVTGKRIIVTPTIGAPNHLTAASATWRFSSISNLSFSWSLSSTSSHLCELYIAIETFRPSSSDTLPPLSGSPSLPPRSWSPAPLPLMIMIMMVDNGRQWSTIDSYDRRELRSNSAMIVWHAFASDYQPKLVPQLFIFSSLPLTMVIWYDV